VKIDDDKALIMIGDKYTEFTAKFFIVNIRGAWYVSPNEDSKTFDKDSKQMVRAYRQFMRVLETIQGKVKRGAITAANIDQAFWPSNPPAAKSPASPAP
jgi:hypothetical protein